MNAGHSWLLAGSFDMPESPTARFGSIRSLGHYLRAGSSRRGGGADGRPSRLAEGQTGSRWFLGGRRALPRSKLWALSRQRNTKRSGLSSQATPVSRIGYRMPRSLSG
jgi:hypothetical protein